MAIPRARFSTNTPLIPAGADLDRELAFYVDALGLAVTWRDTGMAGIRRDDVSFNLIRNDDRGWRENSSFSIGVSDLEALYQEYRAAPARIGPLEAKPWGRREFHMVVPSGVCLQFYQDD